jgi:hypothetical protein
MIDEHMQQLSEMENKLNGERDKLAFVQEVSKTQH